MDEIRIELEALERAGWDALSDGTGAAFYADQMTDDGVMVLAHGQAMTRDQVVDALRGAPPWDDYRLEDVRLVQAGADAAALVYRATASRSGQPAFVALNSSLYVRKDGRWRLALYTQTPVPA